MLVTLNSLLYSPGAFQSPAGGGTDASLTSRQDTGATELTGLSGMIEKNIKSTFNTFA
jgi:hypothetical protein